MKICPDGLKIREKHASSMFDVFRFLGDVT